MGILDAAKNLLGQHDDKVDEALDKVGDVLKSRIPGHDGVIDGVVGKVKAATGDGDTTAMAAPVTADPGTGPDTPPVVAPGAGGPTAGGQPG